MSRRLRVLALASFPVEAAATRFRLWQYRAAMDRRGIDLRVDPMLSSAGFAALYDRKRTPQAIAGLLAGTARRMADTVRAIRADVVLVQREATLFGPPLVEWLAAESLRRPLVLDLDDATWVPYDSPTYGRLGRWLKWPGKADRLIQLATTVICGNRYIADHVEAMGKPTLVLPTLVDLEVYRPRSTSTTDGPPVVGWIGTHSTSPYLDALREPLAALATYLPFRLRVVGAGDGWRSPSGVETELVRWRLGEEARILQSFDVGVYPLPDDAWALGKSGFKAIQYLAVGVPYVVSPVGAVTEIGVAGVTHLEATNHDEWETSLAELLGDTERRRQMAHAGRAHAERHFALEPSADRLAGLLRDVANP